MNNETTIQLTAQHVNRSLIEGVDLNNIYNPVWYGKNVSSETRYPVSDGVSNTEENLLGFLRNSGCDYDDLKNYSAYISHDINDQSFVYSTLVYITPNTYQIIPIKPLKLMTMSEFYQFALQINNPLADKLKDSDKYETAFDYIDDCINKRSN